MFGVLDKFDAERELATVSAHANYDVLGLQLFFECLV